MRLLKIAGVLVVLLGLAAAAIVVGPIVYGQTAVPKLDARPVKAQVQLLGRGGGIGVTLREVDDADVSREKLSSPSGAVVEEVRSESPAAKAGLRAGDVIVEFDGERVRSARHLSRLVDDTPVGRQVPIAVVRGGERVAMRLAPEAASSSRLFRIEPRAFDRLGKFSFDMPDIKVAVPEVRVDVRLSAARLGVTAQDLTPQLAEYFGAKDGVLVTTVVENSTASKAGLKAGDVITSVNGVDVTSAADLRRRLMRLEDGEEFSIGVVRGRQATTLKGKVEPRATPARRTERRIVRTSL